MGDDRASVVIVGGGVVGTSAAFHLAEAGVSDVLLLEQAELGSGSTVRAAGGFRAQFSDELNIAIALRSIAAFEAFAERPGWDINLHQDGYLFLLTDEDDVELFQRNAELQRAKRRADRVAVARAGPGALADRLGGRRARRDVLRAGRACQPGVGRPGLCIRRAGARRRHPHRRRGDRDPHRRRPGHRGGYGRRRCQDRHRGLHGRRLVARGRRDGRRRAARHPRAAARLVHGAGARPAPRRCR